MPATLTYSTFPPQTHAERLWTNTCRHTRYAETHPVQPLKRLGGPRAVSVSYRAFVPAGHDGGGVALSYRALASGGARLPFRITATHTLAKQSSDHCPHTYGVRHQPCAPIATEPCRPTACHSATHSVLSQPITHYSLHITHWTFTFSAKERDSETGLSYFGSRYYSSDLSIWLSVDPQSDKYAYQSGYVYCGNNPIKTVDPNGEDEWDLARDGSLTKRKDGRTDVDIVHATDKNGKDISRYYKAGTINQNHESYPGSLILDKEDPDNSRIDFITDIMTFTDANIATDFFEFAAENTDVEWALNIGETETIVGTSHQDVFNKVPPPQNVKYQIHSHWSYRHQLSYRGPKGEPCPNCDIPMMNNNPNTFKVYEAFNHRYVSMDDQHNFRYEISKNIQKAINLFQTINRFWVK